MDPGIVLIDGKEKITDVDDDGREKITIEKAVEDITKNYTPTMIIIVIYSLMWSAVGPTCTYMPVFAGFIPYNEWKCISDKCFNIKRTAFQNNTDGEFYIKKNLCGNNFTITKDFVWTTNRTSFTIDWNIFCGNEYLHPFISSFYFVGALVGLVAGMGLYERIGRRRGAAIGAFICATGTFLGSFCKHYWLMLIIRFMQGVGDFIAYSGLYIWCLEFSPERLRVYVNVASMALWALGYCVLVLVAYMVTNWNYMCLVLAIYSMAMIPPLLLFPESPRYLLSRGYNEGAKRSLNTFSKISKTNTNYLNVILVHSDDVKQEPSSLKKQMTDFWQYKTLTTETLLQFYLWFVCAGLYYGFSFSWSAIGKNIYTSYIYASFGETIAYILVVPLIIIIGRRVTMMALCVGASISYLIAMIDLPFGGEWSLERLSSIFGTMFVSAALALLYLYTVELAPTTHRGLILSMCSISARFGSYGGPYVSLLFTSYNRRIPLVMFTVLTGVAALFCLVLPDTSGIAVPETAVDVQKRRIDNGIIGSIGRPRKYERVQVGEEMSGI